jgi:hypothetical protein
MERRVFHPPPRQGVLGVACPGPTNPSSTSAHSAKSYPPARPTASSASTSSTPSTPTGSAPSAANPTAAIGRSSSSPRPTPCCPWPATASPPSAPPSADNTKKLNTERTVPWNSSPRNAPSFLEHRPHGGHDAHLTIGGTTTLDGVSGPRGGHRGRNTGGRSESHPDDLAITPMGGELDRRRSRARQQAGRAENRSPASTLNTASRPPIDR